MLRIAKHAVAAGDEQLRHLVIVEIGPDRRIRRRAQSPEDEGDLLQLDKTADLLDRFGRTQAVVEADQIEFSAVDAAHLVGHLAISDFRPPVHAISRGWSAIRHSLADLDLGIRDAGRVGGLRRPCSGREAGGRASARLQKRTTRQHYLGAPPRVFGLPATLGQHWELRRDLRNLDLIARRDRRVMSPVALPRWPGDLEAPEHAWLPHFACDRFPPKLRSPWRDPECPVYVDSGRPCGATLCRNIVHCDIACVAENGGEAMQLSRQIFGGRRLDRHLSGPRGAEAGRSSYLPRF